MSYTNGLDDPTLYFNTVLYTGNGSTPRTVSGVGFQPDFTWIKNRTISSKSHVLVNVIQGYGSSGTTLKSDSSDAAGNTSTTGRVADPGATNDGFTAGDSSFTNDNSQSMVAWNWLASNSTASNTDGTINTSSTSANTTAGFSISKFTASGSGDESVGHGLGVAPSMVIQKEINGTSPWNVYHKSLHSSTPEDYYINLNTSSAAASDSPGVWGAGMTSSVAGVGVGVGVSSGQDYIAYYFAEKKGYSKIGSYVGNGSTSGTYVHLGFKPAFLLYKCSSDNFTNWQIHDSARSPSNLSVNRLNPNDSSVELSTTADSFDLLSNGFKARGTASN